MTMRSAVGSSLSRCQMMSGRRPVLRSSARQTSRSRFEPGKTMTAAFMLGDLGRQARGGSCDPRQIDRQVADDQALAFAGDSGPREGLGSLAEWWQIAPPTQAKYRDVPG